MSKKVILTHHLFGDRVLTIEDLVLVKNAPPILVFKPKMVSNELFDAPEFYVPRPDTVTYLPNWGIAINEGVKVASAVRDFREKARH